MNWQGATLDENESVAFNMVATFLEGRLEERGTVDWALRLTPNDKVQRLALLTVLDRTERQKLRDPWLSAWNWIEESWCDPIVEGPFTPSIYSAILRMEKGDRSVTLARSIVDMAKLRVTVKALFPLELHFRPPTRTPKEVEDLVSIHLEGLQPIDPKSLKLHELSDLSFLRSLAVGLDSVVAQGLNLARRLGWDGRVSLWRLGNLYRVYYVPDDERQGGVDEPDVFNKGLATSVKLLFATVVRLLELDLPGAIEFTNRWKVTCTPVHARLWAAVARDTRVASGDELAEWLLGLDDDHFWSTEDCPEIAEVRAKRFRDLPKKGQQQLASRLQKGPPRGHWPAKADAGRVREARRMDVMRELRRIQSAGGALPAPSLQWMDRNMGAFPDLATIDPADAGFMRAPKADWVKPNPDPKFDFLAGTDRLKALESAFAAGSKRWDDDPSGRAADWLCQAGNATLVLSDFENTSGQGAAFPKVWENFGWAHRPKNLSDSGASEDRLLAEARRVLVLFSDLPGDILRAGLQGLSDWLLGWEQQCVQLPEMSVVWLRFWPLAVEACQAEIPLDVVNSSRVQEPGHMEEGTRELDTLGSPIGKLMWLFMAFCGAVGLEAGTFDRNESLRALRSAATATTGQAGLIVRYRLMMGLNHFLDADPEWTQTTLLGPIRANTQEALSLWTAFASRRPKFNVIAILGDDMVERSKDMRLSRKTRTALVVYLATECLNAFHDGREPAIPRPRLQQMLRWVEDEVRISALEVAQRFLRDAAARSDLNPDPKAPEEIFRSAVVPYLREVWPQENSLVNPGIARALADLPASAGEAFNEAVNLIEPFLVPFKSWSLLDYGLFGNEGDGAKLPTVINDPGKAEALLHLLDRTLESGDGSVVPYDLGSALDQIRALAPALAKGPSYRRLATLARMG